MELHANGVSRSHLLTYPWRSSLQLAMYDAEMTAKDATIKALRAEVAAKDTMIRALQAELAAKDALYSSLVVGFDA